MRNETARIVLIEDNPGDILLVEMALEKYRISCSLLKFQNSQDAVQTMCVARNDSNVVPDLILMDLNTPHSDGFEAVRQLRRSPRMASVPIVILTSSRARSDKLQAATLGVTYIEKSSQLDSFLSSVGQGVRNILHLGDDLTHIASAESQS